MSRTHPSSHRHTNRYPFASRSPRRLVAVSSILHRHARSVRSCLPRPVPPSPPAPAVPSSATSRACARSRSRRGASSSRVRCSHAGRRFPAIPACATRWHLGDGSSRTWDGGSRQTRYALRASVSVHAAPTRAGAFPPCPHAPRVGILAPAAPAYGFPAKPVTRCAPVSPYAAPTQAGDFPPYPHAPRVGILAPVAPVRGMGFPAKPVTSL